MSILKFERRTPRNLKQMYEHIIDKRKTDEDLIFGIGINPLYAVDEMEFVRKIYQKDYFAHQYIQVIFSFDKDVCTRYDLLVIKEICKKIGFLLLTDKRQIVAAIHYKKDVYENCPKEPPNVHCHYLINSVGIDGSFYQQRFSVIFYKKRINQVLEKYHLNPIFYVGG